MPNALLTPNQITREAIRLFTNSNAFLQNVDRQYDDQFARDGGKIGDSLRIRLPNDYTVRTGRVASLQDTNERQTTLTVATQQGVDLNFTSSDLTLSLDDFSERILKPAMNNLAGAVALNVMSMAESASNIVFKDNGSGGIATPDAATWLLAGAKLDNNSAPRGSRFIALDPLSQARTVSSLAGLLNPSNKISQQYETGEMMGTALGFDWLMDQTVLKRTNGTFTAGTVSGAGQTGSTLTTSAITGTLNKGDVITLQGVFAVNRVTKQSTGELQQFVVTANVAGGATSIPIYPAITPGNVAYATVTASPGAGATISLIGGAGATFRKNIAYRPEAFTLATADLEMPKGVDAASRQTFDGVSMRYVSQFDATNDVFIRRLDVLYGYLAVRPEWICGVPDVL